MKRMLAMLLALCLAVGGLGAAAGEKTVYDVPLALTYINGVADHVAFALPASAGLYHDEDSPGYFRDSRQLAGYCIEDGAEFQFRSADIGEWIDTIREDVMAEVPDADEDVVRVNALFAYAMMLPGQYGAEPQTMTPHGIRGKDWLWLEGTFTYPDTPGAVYSIKALLTGTRAATLVMAECAHTQEVMDALRFVEDDELAELEAELSTETTVELRGLSMTFPRKPTRAELGDSILLGAFAADWTTMQVQYAPYTVIIDAPEEKQLEGMLTIGKKAIVALNTETVNDPVLSHPAPDMLQLDFWTRDESLTKAYGPKMLMRVYAGERGTWYVTVEDGESGARFLDSLRLTASGTEAGVTVTEETAPGEPTPAATLPEFKANLARLCPELDLAWSIPVCTGEEWVMVGFPLTAMIGGIRVTLDSSSEEAAIREVRVLAYDGFGGDGLYMASLCAQALGGEAAAIPQPTEEETVAAAGTVRIVAQHLAPEGSALVYDRVILTPETVPPIREPIPVPEEEESVAELERGPTLAELSGRLTRLKDAFLPEDYTLTDAGDFQLGDEPVRLYMVHGGIGAALYLDGEVEDARVSLVVIMGVDGDAPGVLSTTLLFWAAIQDLSDVDAMAISYLLIESPVWDQLADLWPLMARDGVCAFLQNGGITEEDWIPMGFVGGMPGAEKADEAGRGEAVAALRALGIGIPDEAIDEAANTVQEWVQAGYQLEEPLDFLLILLSRLGEGEFHADVEWTPSSFGVYAFDAEIVDYTRMYELFFRGLASIVPGFKAADVSEDIVPWGPDNDPPDFVTGIASEGITKVGFTINGHRYERELLSLGDWFNSEAIGWVNEVLEQEGFEGRIHACDDNGQGLILFYGDEAYGETLRRIIPGAVWETEW
ncbi:MAG: hypothetical protein IKH77_08780 [Clostridia bacterium]|nr:hypothetical protein [Clostridia bacterium]